MANNNKKDQMRYIELGSFVVDYNDGDVLEFNGVNDLSPLYPLKPMTCLIASCQEGWQKITANGNSLKLSKGNVLICPPDTRIVCEDHSSDFECKVVCVHEHLIRSLLRTKAEIWHRAVYIDHLHIVEMDEATREDLTTYFTLIRSKLKRSNGTLPTDILLALLRAFLLELCHMMESTNTAYSVQRLSQGKILFNRFLSLVSNSSVKRLPITEYASKLAITPKYLTMLCLKYSNKTASEWVAQYTVEEIRYYLKSTDLSIKEISARMGFSNMSHFGSYVRKHLGVSPTEYRFSKKE